MSLSNVMCGRNIKVFDTVLPCKKQRSFVLLCKIVKDLFGKNVSLFEYDETGRTGTVVCSAATAQVCSTLHYVQLIITTALCCLMHRVVM
jgi:hypothetical protein